ncbi:AAA family ATPase [Celerinatantimonas sp. MCCC 1A17872]|uniref:AAA family ATPase n=1 Tax=Celerinatantimonas sp. MCCC 1A17872 TaxID=3177514 RepID=UPI0038C3B08A
MEGITIDNFLVVKRAKFEINRINVIIGPQALGKSVVAKVAFFLRNCSGYFIEGCIKENTLLDISKKIKIDFLSRFPKYTWNGTNFAIEYYNGSISIKIIGVKSKSKNNTTIKVSYNKRLKAIYNKNRTLYRKKVESINASESKDASDELFGFFYSDIKMKLFESEETSFFKETVFIPASRSFFSNLQKNIFLFLSSNIDIDPFLKDFGSQYEMAKKMYKRGILEKESFRGNMNENINELFGRILKGQYRSRDDQDWIFSAKERKIINVLNASSGQQESLPFLLVLIVFSRFMENDFFFIEEPEAHLFTDSQSQIVSLLSELYKEDTRFFITTHSPYILTTLNNMIYANDVVGSDADKLAKFKKINGGGEPIKFEDVSAYTIKNGILESILDTKYRMINSAHLDGVSDRIEEVMDNLMEMD